MKRKGLSSAQIIPIGFLLLIAVGTGLLSLPFATASGHRAPFLTALFTSTTSVCVTGLVVVDTFSYWSLFGKLVILSLIQVGGLGIVAVSSCLFMLLRRTFTIRDRAMLRALAEAATEISNVVYEGAGEADAMLEAAERRIYALRQGRSIGGLVPVSSVVQTVFDNLSEASASGKAIPGLSTGLADLDRVTLGLNRSELILVAARPGMGKTSIALNMALHAALNEHQTVAIFSLEMSREQLVMRLLSRAALVPSQNLLTGQLTDQQWRDITTAAQALSATDIRIDDNPTLTVSDMNAQCRRVPNLGLVVVDYLQLMQSAGSGHSWSNESRTQAVSDISRMFKIMAKELAVPVVCLSQLSRANESRQDKRPMLSDLRESGAIEQDADVVIGLYRDGYYNKESENPNLAEAIILKNRKGQTGTVELLWLPEYTSFTMLEKRRDDEY